MSHDLSTIEWIRFTAGGQSVTVHSTEELTLGLHVQEQEDSHAHGRRFVAGFVISIARPVPPSARPVHPLDLPKALTSVIGRVYHLLGNLTEFNVEAGGALSDGQPVRLTMQRLRTEQLGAGEPDIDSAGAVRFLQALLSADGMQINLTTEA
ncbi:hypothetical protein ACFY97_18955 [Streptomyces klenkii]|uniref:hypothetical protein n=1 Tax=Streptomyces klenkii TaxID=1420899 RepID=UPI0036E94C19